MRTTFAHPCWKVRTAGLLLFVAAIGIGSAQTPQAPQKPPQPAAPPKTNDSQAPKTNDSQAAALDLLRKVIAEQQKNPDKIIRVPPPTTPPSARESKASSANTGPRLSRAELERQFLEGKITARQFQRAAAELERNPPPPPPPSVAAEKGKSPAPTKDPATLALSPKAVSGIPGKVITNQPSATPSPASDEEPEQKALSDVEAKIDEILARRVAIAEAAKTNAASTNAVPAGPLTKRQKLDALLRQLIQGKITDQEYNAQREKIVAQPD